MTNPIFTSSRSELELPDILMRSEAELAVQRATDLFKAAYGEPTTLDADLNSASKFFDPVAQGSRLRRELEDLPKSDSSGGTLPATWVITIPGGRSLLTPEGIAGLHALRHSLAESTEPAVFLRASADEAAAVLLEKYRAWARHRLNGVLALLEGSDKPLQFQGAGLLLALLVNGNVGSERALSRAARSDVDKRDAIDAAFDSGVQAFSRQLSPESKTKSGGERLISGWTLGEVARRLGGGLVVTGPSTENSGSVYVREDQRDAAIKLIARDLGRGKRRIPSSRDLGNAFDALVKAFLSERTTLASYGELHENALATSRLRNELLAEFENGLAAS